MKIHEICFSPTGGTKRVATILSQALADETIQVDLTACEVDFSRVMLTAEDVALIAVPSYSGRVPAVAAERLGALHGNGARAILVCVYGNRAYEDTLAELRDTASRAGFTVIAAVAAVAEHSIARQYAAGRPDAEDEAQLRTFAAQIRRKIDTGDQSEPEIPGNHPYRKAAGAGIVPKATRACVKCGLCAAKCPVGAIAPDDPTRVDKTRCISCMRCVAVCPPPRYPTRQQTDAGAGWPYAEKGLFGAEDLRTLSISPNRTGKGLELQSGCGCRCGPIHPHRADNPREKPSRFVRSAA